MRAPTRSSAWSLPGRCSVERGAAEAGAAATAATAATASGAAAPDRPVLPACVPGTAGAASPHRREGAGRAADRERGADPGLDRDPPGRHRLPVGAGLPVVGPGARSPGDGARRARIFPRQVVTG